MTILKRMWCALTGHQAVTLKTPVLAGTRIVCPNCGKLLVTVANSAADTPGL